MNAKSRHVQIIRVVLYYQYSGNQKNQLLILQFVFPGSPFSVEVFDSAEGVQLYNQRHKQKLPYSQSESPQSRIPKVREYRDNPPDFESDRVDGYHERCERESNLKSEVFVRQKHDFEVDKGPRHLHHGESKNDHTYHGGNGAGDGSRTNDFVKSSDSHRLHSTSYSVARSNSKERVLQESDRRQNYRTRETDFFENGGRHDKERYQNGNHMHLDHKIPEVRTKSTDYRNRQRDGAEMRSEHSPRFKESAAEYTFGNAGSKVPVATNAHLESSSRSKYNGVERHHDKDLRSKASPDGKSGYRGARNYPRDVDARFESSSKAHDLQIKSKLESVVEKGRTSAMHEKSDHMYRRREGIVESRTRMSSSPPPRETAEKRINVSRMHDELKSRSAEFRQRSEDRLAVEKHEIDTSIRSGYINSIDADKVSVSGEEDMKLVHLKSTVELLMQSEQNLLLTDIKINISSKYSFY